MKKRIAIVVLVFFILALCFAAYLFYKWKNPTVDTTFEIPEYADVVACIHTPQLIEILHENANQIGTEKSNLSNSELLNLGLNPMTPIWVFAKTQSPFLGLAISCSKPDNFFEFLGKQGITISKKNKEKNLWLLNNTIHVIEKNGYLYFLTKDHNTDSILWKNEWYSQQLKSGIFDLNKSIIVGMIQRTAQIFTSQNLEVEKDILFRVQNNKGMFSLHHTALFESDLHSLVDSTLPLSLCLPAHYSKLPYIQKYLISILQKQGFNLKINSESKQDFISFQYTGNTHEVNYFTSYKINEEFEKVAVVKTQQRIVPNYFFSIPAADCLWWSQLKSDSVYFNSIKKVSLLSYPAYCSCQNQIAILSATQDQKNRKNSSTKSGILFLNPTQLAARLKELNIPVPDYNWIKTIKNVEYNCETSNQMRLNIHLFDKNLKISHLLFHFFSTLQ